MKNVEIKINISINDNGELTVNDTKVFNLNNSIKKLTTDFVIKESQSRYGYLHFPKSTGFQDIIKNGRDITIHYNQKKYYAKNYEPTPGRINGLSNFFQENNIVENDKFKMELIVNKEPLELYIEKI